MLSSVLWSGHLEDVGDAEERLPGVSVGYHLQDGEIFQYTVHHVSLREVLQLPAMTMLQPVTQTQTCPSSPDEVDHVFTHRTALYLVKVSPSFIPRVLRLHLLHHLLSKTAHFGGALDGHVLGALVPETLNSSETSVVAQLDCELLLRIISKCTIIAALHLIIMRQIVIFKVCKEHRFIARVVPDHSLDLRWSDPIECTRLLGYLGV